MLIVLAGTIGAGKSSLAAALGEHLGTEVFYEAVDNNPVVGLISFFYGLETFIQKENLQQESVFLRVLVI